MAVGEAQITQDSQTAIILAVIGLLSLVLVAVVTGVFSLLTARNAKAAATSSPMPDPGHVLYERVAVLERRADDADDRDDIQDRRLDQIERAVDVDNPNWRHRDQ